MNRVFEWLFKYPPVVFERGEISFAALSSTSAWMAYRFPVGMLSIDSVNRLLVVMDQLQRAFEVNRESIPAAAERIARTAARSGAKATVLGNSSVTMCT